MRRFRQKKKAQAVIHFFEEEREIQTYLSLILKLLYRT